MEISDYVLLFAVLAVFVALDIVMLVSLLIPGDERSQLIVWKASSFTLLSVIGSMGLDVAEGLIRGRAMTANSLIMLEVTATVYFFALLYFKRKHRGA